MFFKKCFEQVEIKIMAFLLVKMVGKRALDLLTMIFSKIQSHDIPPSEKIHVFYSFFQFFRVFLYLLRMQMHFAGQTLCSFVNFNPYILFRSKFAYKLVKIVSKHTFLYVFMRFLPFFDIFLYFFALIFQKSHKKL